MTLTNFTRIGLLFIMIVAAALTRLLPHPPNLTAIGAIALFGGACISNRWIAIGMTLAALAISDLFLGVYELLPVVYLSFLISFLLGRWLRSHRNLANTVYVVLAGAIQFFLITNFACWWYYYPHTPAGLISCLTLAIPFFQYTLLGDLLYVTALFGGLALVERSLPAIREEIAALSTLKN